MPSSWRPRWTIAIAETHKAIRLSFSKESESSQDARASSGLPQTSNPAPVSE